MKVMRMASAMIQPCYFGNQWIEMKMEPSYHSNSSRRHCLPKIRTLYNSYYAIVSIPGIFVFNGPNGESACGLWLHKFKTMRPENKWNKVPPKDKKKRKTRRTKPPSVAGAATRSRSKAQASKRAESSPGPTEASSPPVEDETALEIENGNGNRSEEDIQPPRSISRRAN